MIYLVGGTRPNFIKIAPISRAFEKRNILYDIIHTGQHYDYNMDKIFFDEFGLKAPSVHLGVGSGPHGEQTAKIMERFERLCFDKRPDMVFVVGDVNSTMGTALVTSKLRGVKLVHVEAGGRSFDRDMPEEINRIVTDSISDILFAIEPAHVTNLLHEGVDKSKIYLVGDTIIDNLIYTLSKITEDSNDKYILVTIHRQSNTDNIDNLKNILKSLTELSKIINIKFPIHPRTLNTIKNNGLEYLLRNIDVLEPLGYFDFVKTMKGASVIVTDSGGITIEAAVLEIPCVVVRNTLERMFLIEEETTVLCGISEIINKVNLAIEKGSVKLSQKWRRLLDGNASERIANIIGGVNVHTSLVYS